VCVLERNSKSRGEEKSWRTQKHAKGEIGKTNLEGLTNKRGDGEGPEEHKMGLARPDA